MRIGILSLVSECRNVLWTTSTFKKTKTIQCFTHERLKQAKQG